MSKVYVRFYAVTDAFNNRVQYSIESEHDLRKRYRNSKDRDTLNSFLSTDLEPGSFVVIGPDMVFCRQTHAYEVSDDLFDFNMEFKDGMG